MSTLNGKKVVDADAPLTFTVTKSDCKKGKPKKPMSCALAQGLSHRAEVLSARIGKNVALIEFDDKVVRYAIKAEDRVKIDAFDYAHFFQPGRYTLEKPKGALSQVRMKAAWSRRKTSKRKGGTHVARRTPMRHAMHVEKS